MIVAAAAILILAYSIILHEVSHGAVAQLYGDPTARNEGRLTLNPLKHVDPLGTVILPAFLFFLQSPILFGWAKPVPYNPLYFRNRKLGVVTVAAAGPVTNLLLAFAFAALLKTGPAAPWESILFYGVSLNAMLAIFNLLPIPPLDGSKVLAALLPPAARAAYLSIERFGFFIVFALMFTGVLGRLLVPAYRWVVLKLIS